MRKIDYSGFTQHGIHPSTHIPIFTQMRNRHRQQNTPKQRIPKPIHIPFERYRVSESELIPGQRYTFYRNPELTRGYNAVFRACLNRLYVYDVIDSGVSPTPTTQTAKHIHFDCIDYEPHPRTRLAMPFDWLIQITNLITILQNKSPFPDDVLRIIDSYV